MLEQLKEELKPFIAEEKRLMDEYDQIVFRGKYEHSDGWNYMDEMGKELGKSKEGVLEESIKDLVGDSEVWKEASRRVLGKRREFIENRRKTIDYKAALGILIEIMEIRKPAYEKMLGFRGSLVDAGQLSRDPELEGDMFKLMTYIDGFPLRVTELIERFPYSKSMWFEKLLPPYARQQQLPTG